MPNSIDRLHIDRIAFPSRRANNDIARTDRHTALRRSSSCRADGNHTDDIRDDSHRQRTRHDIVRNALRPYCTDNADNCPCSHHTRPIESSPHFRCIHIDDIRRPAPKHRPNDCRHNDHTGHQRIRTHKRKWAPDCADRERNRLHGKRPSRLCPDMDTIDKECPHRQPAVHRNRFDSDRNGLRPYCRNSRHNDHCVNRTFRRDDCIHNERSWDNSRSRADKGHISNRTYSPNMYIVPIERCRYYHELRARGSRTVRIRWVRNCESPVHSVHIDVRSHWACIYTGHPTANSWHPTNQFGRTCKPGHR